MKLFLAAVFVTVCVGLYFYASSSSVLPTCTIKSRFTEEVFQDCVCLGIKIPKRKVVALDSNSYVDCYGLILKRIKPGSPVSVVSFWSLREENHDFDTPRQALKNYFSALFSKDYMKAQEYHGSGYDKLKAANPGVYGFDHPQLLKNACEVSGYICLEIHSITREEALSPEDTKFTVTFKKRDGSIYGQERPLTHAGNYQPPNTEFDFVVRRRFDGYKVVTPLLLEEK